MHTKDNKMQVLAWLLVHEVKTAGAARQQIHNVRQPATHLGGLTAFYYAGHNFVASTASAHAGTWQNANPPANDAAAFLHTYLQFDMNAVPPLFYFDKFDEEDIVGKYIYSQNQSISIQILNSLNTEIEFYVVLHELLHWAGFGNLHGSPNYATVAANWDREFISPAPPGYTAHWENVSGVHKRTMYNATSEIMTAKLSGNLFLSGTTLLACTRDLGGLQRACIDNSDCNGLCRVANPQFPGLCDNFTSSDPRSSLTTHAHSLVVFEPIVAAAIFIAFVGLGVVVFPN